jgi:hypothetical protein
VLPLLSARLIPNAVEERFQRFDVGIVGPGLVGFIANALGFDRPVDGDGVPNLPSGDR